MAFEPSENCPQVEGNPARAPEGGSQQSVCSDKQLAQRPRVPLRQRPAAAGDGGRGFLLLLSTKILFSFYPD